MAEIPPKLEYSHIKPPESKRKFDEHKHQLKFENGYADLEYCNDPFPFYYVSFIWVDMKKRGEGIGVAILKEIDDFLNSKGKAGLLIDAIKSSSPARGMYQRNGWEQVPGKPGWYGYNLPKNLEIRRLEKAVYKIETIYSSEKKKAA